MLVTSIFLFMFCFFHLVNFQLFLFVRSVHKYAFADTVLSVVQNCKYYAVKISLLSSTSVILHLSEICCI